jgi:hypothetical protein
MGSSADVGKLLNQFEPASSLRVDVQSVPAADVHDMETQV